MGIRKGMALLIGSGAILGGVAGVMMTTSAIGMVVAGVGCAAIGAAGFPVAVIGGGAIGKALLLKKNAPHYGGIPLLNLVAGIMDVFFTAPAQALAKEWRGLFSSKQSKTVTPTAPSSPANQGAGTLDGCCSPQDSFNAGAKPAANAAPAAPKADNAPKAPKPE